MRIEYERAMRIPPEVRQLKLKAKKTKHYLVAGFLERGQVVEVDADMGRKLLEMHEDLELVEEKGKDDAGRKRTVQPE